MGRASRRLSVTVAIARVCRAAGGNREFQTSRIIFSLIRTSEVFTRDKTCDFARDAETARQFLKVRKSAARVNKIENSIDERR